MLRCIMLYDLAYVYYYVHSYVMHFEELREVGARTEVLNNY